MKGTDGTTNSGASIEGIGFAIPINDVMEVVADLLEFGYVKTAYMGVTVLDFDSSVAEMYNLPAGVFIQSVEAPRLLRNITTLRQVTLFPISHHNPP